MLFVNIYRLLVTFCKGFGQLTCDNVVKETLYIAPTLGLGGRPLGGCHVGQEFTEEQGAEVDLGVRMVGAAPCVVEDGLRRSDSPYSQSFHDALAPAIS